LKKFAVDCEYTAAPAVGVRVGKRINDDEGSHRRNGRVAVQVLLAHIDVRMLLASIKIIGEYHALSVRTPSGNCDHLPVV
jgi:hypothetical protein